MKKTPEESGKHKPSPVSTGIYKWEALVFNVCCGLYYLFLSQPVSSTMRSVAKGEQPSAVWLGIIILAVFLFETYAVYKKTKYVKMAIEDQGDMHLSVLGVFLWMGHLFISAMLLFSIYRCFGGGTDVQVHPLVMGLLLLLVVAKEVFVLVSMFSDVKDKARYKRPNRREWVADIVLISYACIVFSVTWESVTVPLTHQNWGTVIFDSVIATFFFLLFYYPARFAYTLEEMAQTHTDSDHLRNFVSFLFVYMPIYARLYGM